MRSSLTAYLADCTVWLIGIFILTPALHVGTTHYCWMYYSASVLHVTLARTFLTISHSLYNFLPVGILNNLSNELRQAV